MTRRTSRRKVLPFPQSAASSKPIETAPLSDGERLAWERFVGPAKQAVVVAQQALDNSAVCVIEGLMREHGIKKEDGWQFNEAKMRWERRPIPKEE